MKRSKAYRQAAEKVDRSRFYSPLEAAALAKETSPSRMDATVEVAMQLGVDPRKADQMVRGTVNLPHGTGKTARVIVFATGDKAEEARAAGATVIFANHPLERRFRDIHTVTQQLQGQLKHFETVGAWIMGADTDLTFV